MAKSLKLLEACKKWGGPVTENSVNSLEDLDKEQLLTEVKYMRLTIAPNIREKRKGNKFVKFDKAQLIYQILNAIKPVSDDSQDVERGLSGVFVSEKEKNVEFVIDEIDKETVSESIITKLYPGVVGLFSGPVGNSNMLQLYES